METIIERVVNASGRYVGSGDDAGSGPFTATIDITPLLGGMGAAIDYVATSGDGTELHSEHTVLALDMWSGEATLYVLCAELQGMGRLVQVGESTFSNGRGTDGLELQIEILLDEEFVYVWSWGAPDEPLAERWRATFPRR